MTAPDPRLGEIEAIPTEAVEAAARAMLDALYSDKTLKVDDEDRDIVRAIFQAAHPVLLAELRKAHEALARVEALHEPIEALMYSGPQQRLVKVCTGCGTDDGNWQRWPCPTINALEVTQ